MLYAQIEHWMMFAGISLMLLILLRRYRRYYGKLKRSNARRDRQPQAVSRLKREGVPQSPLADAPPEALRWQVEMHDTARDLKAELDSKIGVLQTLVRMADERIAALSVATERHRAAIQQDPLNKSEVVSVTQATEKPLSHDHSPREIGSESLRRSIFELAERGWDAGAIAAEIERPVGDVEMILSLRSSTR